MTETYGYDKTPTPPRDYDASKVPAEIRKRATWVKTKFTGEDVAEAYAQGMEIAGLIANEALEAQAYDGNSLADVTLAKDGLSTLDARIRRDVNNLENKKADKAEVTAQLAQKATKGEIGTSDLNKNKIQFDASWFSDQFLADLSSNEINTTLLEEGSVTTDKLADKAVELEKLGFVTVNRTNLANPDEFVNNSYVSIATGNVLSFEGEVLTGYIPVEEGKQYTATSDRNKAFYDKNKTFVSGIGGDNGKTFTSPIDGYVRLSFIASDTLQMVVEGSTVPTKHIPYDYHTVGFTDEHWKHSIKQALELTTTSLNGLKWNALGDSITAGAQSTASYIDYIAEDTGVIARNYGVSGNTIAHIPGHWAGDGMAIRYAEMDDDADIITVFGGTNDWGHGLVEIGSWNDGTNTTLYGGTQTLIEGLINKYPTKKIGFILPIPRNDINGDNALGDYVAVIKEVCDRYSIPTLDLYHESGIMPGLDAHKTALIPDGTHPNAEGHRMIANKIQRFLERL